MKDTELLINTQSRQGKSAKVEEILHGLNEAGFKKVKVHRITKKKPFEEVLGEVTRSTPKLLIVASGDGTLSSVVDKLAGTTIELGIIPTGTTNNLARSLDIPLDIEGAIDIISTKKARTIDVGTVNGHVFSNVAGIGLSARIANTVKHSHKQRWGRLAYGYTALRAVYNQKPFRITIQDPDNQLNISLETRQFIIANGRFHSGREIASDTNINNGKLVLFSLGGGSRLSLILRTLDFYFGSRKKIVHASYFVGKRVKVSTSSPQNIELDGEVRTKTPADIEVLTAVIKVRY